jgi:hypothetical protein
MKTPQLKVKNSFLMTKSFGNTAQSLNLIQLNTDRTAKDPEITIPLPLPNREVSHYLHNYFSFDLFPRINDLMSKRVDQTRHFYYSSSPVTVSSANAAKEYYLTEYSSVPKTFNILSTLNQAVNSVANSVGIARLITVYQNTTEDWVIQNRDLELHTFHIHQGSFLILERNGKPVSHFEQQVRDSVYIEAWSGDRNQPFPSIKIRFDFSRFQPGLFTYECNLASHIDHGMQGGIQVKEGGINTINLLDLIKRIYGSISSWKNATYSLSAMTVVLAILLVISLGYHAMQKKKDFESFMKEHNHGNGMDLTGLAEGDLENAVITRSAYGKNYELVPMTQETSRKPPHSRIAHV